MWKSYPGRVEGIHLEGDPKVRALRWWNMLFLRRYYWKTVTILHIPPVEGPYRVGFIDAFGNSKYDTTLRTSSQFAVRHGRGYCRFFAILQDGTELPLVIVARIKLEDLPHEVPLV